VGAVRLVLRSQLRTHHWPLLGLTLLVAMAGSVTLAAAAGARRTASSFERFAAATLARDAAIQLDLPGAVATGVGGRGRPRPYPVPARGPGLAEPDLDMAVIASPDGWGRDIDRGQQALAADHPIDLSSYSHPRLPGNLANIDRTRGIVVSLGASFAVLGAIAVGHALVVAGRRQRRDAGVLRALGFLRRQVRAMFAWHSATAAAVAVVAGLPIGVAAGRWVWRAIVGDLGLIDDPTVPAVALAAIGPLSLAVAVGLSWIPGRQASRLSPSVLRAE